MEGKAMTTQHSIIKAMEGGLVGTLLQTLMVYAVIPMLTAFSVDTTALFERACDVGMLAHVITGAVLFPLGYVLLAANNFPGSPMVKGMLWAGLLWLIAEAVLAPLSGAGIFSAELGGFAAAGRALLGYLVYGAALGGIAHAAEPEGRYTAALAPVRAR
jgi:hypothetical protein